MINFKKYTLTLLLLPMLAAGTIALITDRFLMIENTGLILHMPVLIHISLIFLSLFLSFRNNQTTDNYFSITTLNIVTILILATIVFTQNIGNSLFSYLHLIFLNVMILVLTFIFISNSKKEKKQLLNSFESAWENNTDKHEPNSSISDFKIKYYSSLDSNFEEVCSQMRDVSFDELFTGNFDNFFKYQEITFQKFTNIDYRLTVIYSDNLISKYLNKELDANLYKTEEVESLIRRNPYNIESILIRFFETKESERLIYIQNLESNQKKISQKQKHDISSTTNFIKNYLL